MSEKRIKSDAFWSFLSLKWAVFGRKTAKKDYKNPLLRVV